MLYTIVWPLTCIKFWNESSSVTDGVLAFINLSKDMWDTRRYTDSFNPSGTVKN